MWVGERVGTGTHGQQDGEGPAHHGREFGINSQGGEALMRLK